MQFDALSESKDFVNALFYGQAGAGKSTSLAKAANKGRVLVVDAEGGFKKSALARQGVNVDNLFFWPPKGERITAEGLLDVHLTVLEDIQNKPGSWYAVGFDSLTEIASTLRENATDARVRSMGARGNPNFVDRADYGVSTNQMRKVIRRFRDLPCHFVCTALEKVNEDLNERHPALTPALAIDVLGYMDCVLYHRVDSSGVYKALTQRNDTTQAKDRFGILPRVLIEPSFERIVGYVTGELDESKDPLQLTNSKTEENKKEKV